MGHFITEHASQHLHKQLDKIAANKQDGFSYLKITFKKDHLFKQIVGSPLSAKRQISHIHMIHNKIINQLDELLNDVKDFNVYILEDMSIFATLKLTSSDDKHSDIALFLKDTIHAFDEYIEGCLKPIMPANAKQLIDINKQSLKSKEWAMFETAVNTTKRRTIPEIRNYRDKPVVLVVEDDPFVAHQIKEFLKDNVGVMTVSTAEEAIQHYIDMAPNCILLDIHLPGKDGFDALSCIKRIDPEANIAMMTGDRLNTHIQKAHELGAMNFVEKPVARDYLLSVLDTMPLLQKTARH